MDSCASCWPSSPADVVLAGVSLNASGASLSLSLSLGSDGVCGSFSGCGVYFQAAAVAVAAVVGVHAGPPAPLWTGRNAAAFVPLNCIGTSLPN